MLKSEMPSFCLESLYKSKRGCCLLFINFLADNHIWSLKMKHPRLLLIKSNYGLFPDFFSVDLGEGRFGNTKSKYQFRIISVDLHSSHDIHSNILTFHFIYFLISYAM